jgi:hypothetical protein
MLSQEGGLAQLLAVIESVLPFAVTNDVATAADAAHI